MGGGMNAGRRWRSLRDISPPPPPRCCCCLEEDGELLTVDPTTRVRSGALAACSRLSVPEEAADIALISSSSSVGGTVPVSSPVRRMCDGTSICCMLGAGAGATSSSRLIADDVLLLRSTSLLDLRRAVRRSCSWSPRSATRCTFASSREPPAAAPLPTAAGAAPPALPKGAPVSMETRAASERMGIIPASFSRRPAKRFTSPRSTALFPNLFASLLVCALPRQCCTKLISPLLSTPQTAHLNTSLSC